MPSKAVSSLLTVSQQNEGGGFLARKAVGSRALPHVDPFIMLDHVGPVSYGPGEAIGAPDHPHRGFEVVTYVLNGEMEHKDSVGNSGLLKSGWVQWMTAGRGVVHSEMPSDNVLKNGGEFEGFQLWVNLPKSQKMIEPRYQDTAPDTIPVVNSEDGKATIKVIAGSALGKKSPIETKTEICYLDIVISAGACYTQPLPRTYHGFAYCYRGEGLVGSANAPIKMGQIAVLSESEHGDSFTMKAKSDQECRLLLICGEPIKEPIVHSGPFVMNTEEEIRQAFTDYKNGILGSIPGAEDRYKQTEAARTAQQNSGSL